MKPSFAPQLSALAVALFAIPGQAQVVINKVNIGPHQTSASSFPLAENGPIPGEGPMAFGELGGELYFTAQTLELGRVLYKSDGSAAGTQVVHDPMISPSPTFINEMESFGGRLYMTGYSQQTGSELWSTAGTAASSKLEFDLWPSVNSSTPRWLTSTATKLFFVATLPSVGEVIIALDGTPGSSPVVIDTGTLGVAPNIRNLVAHPSGTGILFEAIDAGHLVPWSSDGTQAGTFPLTSPGNLTYGFDRPVPLGSGVVFLGAPGTGGVEPFFTDGTAAGTGMLSDIEPGIEGSDPVLSRHGLSGGLLYFTATNLATGRELYQTDGTAAGTSLVVDGVPGPGGSEPVLVGEGGGKMLLLANLDPGLVGRELYRVDPGAMTLVRDFSAGVAGGVALSSELWEGEPLGGDLLLSLTTGLGAHELWLTDGTTGGTTFVNTVDGNAQAASLTALSPSEVLFSGVDQVVGRELFRTMGTPGTTLAVANINTQINHFSSDATIIDCVGGEELYMLARSVPFSAVEYGRWSPANGTEFFLGLFPSSQYDHLEAWSGDHSEFLFGKLVIGGLGVLAKIFRTDGTALGTHAIEDALGTLTSSAGLFGSDGELTYFRGVTDAAGAELWVTDGTDAGTRLVIDLEPGPAHGLVIPTGPRGLCHGGDFYFTGNDGVLVGALWKTDGTAAGTTLVSDINPTGTSKMGELFVEGDTMFFSADDGVHGQELWKSDGTPGGTQLVKDLVPGAAFGDPMHLRSIDGKLYFWTGADGAPGRDLWESDGTAAGTFVVATLPALTVLQDDVVQAGSRLYFGATDAATGEELWSFDGSTLSMTLDIYPGAGGSGPGEMLACGDRVYFRAYDGVHGWELFVSDGTSLGTQLVFDLNPGSDSSNPAGLTLCRGKLYFAAVAGDGDRELYELELPGAHVVDLKFSGSGARLSATAPALGSVLTAQVDLAPAGQTGFLLMSPVASVSSAFASFGSASWIDPLQFRILTIQSAPSWSLSATLPAAPGFIGLERQIQAWFLDPLTAQATTSNGLRLVFGL